MMFNRHSIKSQMALLVLVTSVSIAILGMLFHIWYSLSHEKQTFVHESTLEAELMADLVAAPLAFFDLAGVNTHLGRLAQNDDLVMAIVYDAQENPIAVINPTKRKLTPPAKTFGTLFEHQGWLNLGNLKISLPIRQSNLLLGYIYIEKSSQRITHFIMELLITVTLVTSVLSILVFFVSRALSKKILQPVLALAATAKEVAETGNYSLRATHNKDNEMSYLFDTFNHLLIETQSLTADLEARVEERTSELQESFTNLQKAQAQLIQAEKMASLGNLVSGVAHEVNTPLGNALTGGSIIVHETKELLEQIERGTLKKSTMQESLSTLNTTAMLLLKSLTQAANLIRSFKRISVDQSVEEQRDFNLYRYIEEIVLTFHSKIKKVPAEVIIEGDKELVIRSYPGVYAQIISNFIQNTLLHAFNENTLNPRITIRLVREDDTLIVRYSDNGMGMDEQIKSVAFDPFTTTKRNAGGTGLGLNIVYNLVTQKLKGSIVMDSVPNEGVTYTLTLPLDVTDSSTSKH